MRGVEIKVRLVNIAVRAEEKIVCLGIISGKTHYFLRSSVVVESSISGLYWLINPKSVLRV